MYPAYRWTDSYPHHTQPMHYAPTDNRRHKDIPSHMNIDPTTLNLPYLPWPYGGNYYCSVPQEYHGCCNHGYFGSGPCSFRPPYPHYPPPPSPYGYHPPFPGVYHAYSSPPPHYLMEQPRYDYDKNTHGPHHCCGGNHQEDDKKLRIEQEDREVEKKTSDSLVPFLLKNQPYPIMWVPPDYMDNKSKAKEEEKCSHDPVSVLSKPHESLKQVGNDETKQDQQSGDGNRFPFPIFWLPYKNNEVRKDTKEGDHNLIAHKELPFSGVDDNKKPTRRNDVGSNSEALSEMSGKHAVQKVIPVKQLGTDEEKNSPRETKMKSSSVEKTNDGIEGKPSPKTSKLPPVCLRIDPLPKKRNSSRSPSPPGDKGRSKGSPANDSKSSQQRMQVSEGLKKTKEEQTKNNTKTIEVINDANPVEKDSLVDLRENVPENLEIKDHEEGNESEKEMVQDQSGEAESCKEEEKKKNLSEHEAALIIQSAYRGFEVRKSQPLMKMSQIAVVRKQATKLRNHIQDLESSSSPIRIDEKQKLIIGETIMNLLLKLDTIQGLHPIVRDVRKSVAKELVGLQEKLDSLTSLKSETLSEETTASKKQVVLPEDDTVQEKSNQPQAQSNSDVQPVNSGSGLHEDCEVEPTESRDYGGSEASNTSFEPQVELQSEQRIGELDDDRLQMSTMQTVDDAIQEKFDQTQAQYDNHELEATDSVHESNQIIESDNNDQKDAGVFENHQVVATDSVHESREPSMEALNSNRFQMQVEAEQRVCDAIQRPESGTNVVAMENDIFEHREVKGAESQENGGTEAHDINFKQHEVEAKESRDDGNSQTELSSVVMEVKSEQPKEAPPLSTAAIHILSGGERKLSEKNEQPVEQKKSDQTETQFENDVKNMNSVVESKGSKVKSESPEEVLREEKEKLRVAVEELMKAGNEQLSVIRELTGKVKYLEKKLSKKKKIKVKKCRSHGSV